MSNGFRDGPTLDIIAALVTSVWAASMIVDMYSKSYTPPLMTHFILMLAVGMVFGIKKGSGTQS